METRHDIFNLPDMPEIKRSEDILRKVMAVERGIIADLIVERRGESVKNSKESAEEIANQIITVLAFRAITDVTNKGES